MDGRKFEKAKILDRKESIIEGMVKGKTVILRVHDGLPAKTLYVTVAEEPLEDGTIRVGCHRAGKGPLTAVASIYEREKER